MARLCLLGCCLSSEGEAIQPGEVLAQVAVADAGFVFAVGHVEAPMARVLDGTVATMVQWLRTA